MNGISFIVRARDEGEHLERCITSLYGLKIPYEVRVVLHKCTDNSRKVLKKLKIEDVRDYELDVSRAGYETLVTPVNHPNSFITYSKFCFEKPKYNWLFRWDADFFASKELIEALNKLELDTLEKVPLRIPCELGKGGTFNEEIYLSNCLLGIDKHIFWETYKYDATKAYALSSMQKITSLPQTHIKEYWNDKPWFIKKDSILDYKYRQLVDLIGSEPFGLARASNEACTPYLQMVMEKRSEIEKIGIHFTR